MLGAVFASEPQSSGVGLGMRGWKVAQQKRARSQQLGYGYELWDTQDLCHHPGEHPITWLLQCRHRKASSLELEHREAKQLDPSEGR